MKYVISGILTLQSICSFSQSTADDFYRLAKYNDSLGNMNTAVEYYSKTLEVNPSYLNAYFNRGSILAQQNKYQAALVDFKKFDSISPNDFEVLYLMGACNYYLKDKSTSEKLVDKALKDNPDFFEANKLKGSLLLDRNSFNEAITIINKALNQKTDPELYSMLGVAYDGLKDNQNAFENYLKAERGGYSHPLLFNNLGRLYTIKKDQNTALIYFNRALEIDPAFSVCYYNKGIALNEMGFTKLALESWTKAYETGFRNFSASELKSIGH